MYEEIATLAEMLYYTRRRQISSYKNAILDGCSTVDSKLDYDGIGWYSMVFDGIAWYSMVFCYSIVFIGIQWYCMVYDGIAGFYMVFDGIQ